MVRTRPMMEFILLWTSSGSPSFNKAFQLRHPVRPGEAEAVPSNRFRYVVSTVCMGEMPPQLSGNNGT